MMLASSTLLLPDVGQYLVVPGTSSRTVVTVLKGLAIVSYWLLF